MALQHLPQVSSMFSRKQGPQDFSGSPASDSSGMVISPRVEDVLSGKSAATDRASLQELMNLKTPMQVS